MEERLLHYTVNLQHSQINFTCVRSPRVLIPHPSIMWEYNRSGTDIKTKPLFSNDDTVYLKFKCIQITTYNNHIPLNFPITWYI